MAADPETLDLRLDAARLCWLSGALALVLAPHVGSLPLWIPLTFATLALWRLASLRGDIRLPGRWLQTLLSVLVFAGVYVSFGTVLGRNAGVALLAVLAGMKLLETRTLRDAYIACFLGYFLVIARFLYSQSIPTGLYMVVVVTALTATLIALNGSEPPRRVLPPLRLAGVMLAQAAPLAVALFLLFPRIAGPLWGLPEDAFGARTGLAETMSPGSISQLGQSDAVAFRVAFEGVPPPPAQRYWRGPVLWHTDGRTWSAPPPRLHRAPPGGGPAGPPVDYTVTIEPHQRTWLFALDLPVTVPDGARITDAFQLVSRKPVRQRRRYSLRSYPEYRNTWLTAGERAAALQLPPGAHPEARALARRWRGESDSAAQVVGRALAYFSEQPFYYTLTPPRLTGDPVDQFLFDSRRGFCEHFAGAFTVLMRAAGIPARVVTGYQGGERNPLGDYLIVRQRDAHAWAEVWLDGRGWMRVDPTAAVAPGRIELGMEATLPSRIGVAGIELSSNDAVRTLWRRLRQGWDGINNAWNQWVLGYGPTRQSDLLARFGLDPRRWLQLALTLTGAVALLLASVAAWLLHRRRPPDPALRAYRRFCAKLARAGIARRAHEGPVAYAARVRRARPRLAPAVDRVTDLYVRLRYGGGDAEPRELRRAVAAFRP